MKAAPRLATQQGKGLPQSPPIPGTRPGLEYFGTLPHGLRRAGLDAFDAFRPLTCDPDLRQAVEWLGCPWGHAVAPSTPVQDYRLHVRAWQHHFAAIFGPEALGRVRGVS